MVSLLPAPVRHGFRLTEAAIGVGVLLLPPILADDRPEAAAAWAWCCALGVLVGYATATAGTGPRAVGRRLPAAAGSPVVTAWYVAGTVVGQGFICWTAAAYATGTVGGGRPLVAVLALAVLLVSAGTAVQGRPLSASLRRCRLIATVALATVWAIWPAVVPLDPNLFGPAPSGLALAVFVLLISAVGWESAREVTGERHPGPALLLGGGLVGALTVAVSLGHQARDGTAGPGPLPVRVAITVAVLLLAVSYCSSNLRVAGRLLGEVRATRATTGAPPPALGPAAAVGCVAGAASLAVVLAGVTGTGTWQLLLGPGAMTCAIFAAFTLRILLDRQAPIRARAASAAALLLLGGPALASGVALLFPFAVGALTIRNGRTHPAGGTPVDPEQPPRAPSRAGAVDDVG